MENICGGNVRSQSIGIRPVRGQYKETSRHSVVKSAGFIRTQRHRHRSPRSQLDPNWLISPRVPRAHLPGLSVSHQMSRGCKLQQISRGCSRYFYPDTEHWTGRRAVTFIKSWLNWSFFDLSSPCLLVWNCQKSCRVSGSIMLSNCYLGRYQGGTNPISLE